MKKYHSFGKLLADYRKFHNLSLIELAAKLDVDVRTVTRWEKDESFIKADKEKDVVEILNIPHQVVRNLNTDYPIPVYYSIKLRTYSLSSLLVKPIGAAWYKSDLPREDELIHLIANDSDVEFVTDIQEMNNNPKPVKAELVKEAAKLLPELNLMLVDQSGYYAGHISVLPLKYSSYKKIRERKMDEGALQCTDLSSNFTKAPLVFYFYSLYADSLENSYHLINRLLSYFKEKKFDDYLFAGITYRENKVDLLREMGIKVIWKDTGEEGSEVNCTFMEGDLDMFLFRETR